MRDSMQINNLRLHTGFTVLELMLTLSILGVLFALTVVNLTNIIPKANTRAAAEVLIADLREQQMKAMSGYEAVVGGASDYGIFFETDAYTLFTGSDYVEGHQENYVVSLQAGLEFDTTNLPLSRIVYLKGSGEVANYSETYHSIRIRNIVTTELRTIVYNQLGVLELL
jgi:prepilin-type N-terminal cleavage/methylation domain-containing protein